MKSKKFPGSRDSHLGDAANPRYDSEVRRRWSARLVRPLGPPTARVVAGYPSVPGEFGSGEASGPFRRVDPGRRASFPKIVRAERPAQGDAPEGLLREAQR